MALNAEQEKVIELWEARNRYKELESSFWAAKRELLRAAGFKRSDDEDRDGNRRYEFAVDGRVFIMSMNSAVRWAEAMVDEFATRLAEESEALFDEAYNESMRRNHGKD